LQDLRFYKWLLKKYDISYNPEMLLNEHNMEYNSRILEIRTALPGLTNLINSLRKSKIKMAICSGSYLDQIKTALRNLSMDSMFDAIVSCEMTNNHKPHPEPYLMALKTLNVKSNECLAFEDSENGVLSAKKAGIYCVGVEIGNHNTQNLKRVGADHITYSLEEFDVSSFL
jgi:HAD superfamily hydrolase (TIGR01509 family)